MRSKKEKMCLSVEKMFLRARGVSSSVMIIPDTGKVFLTKTLVTVLAATMWLCAWTMCFYIPIVLFQQSGPIPFPWKVTVLIVSVFIFFGFPLSVYFIRKRRLALPDVENAPEATVVRYLPNPAIPSAPPLPVEGIPVAAM